MDRAAVRVDMEEARLDFHRLVGQASAEDLRQPSDGTRWSNQQLLFHMLFGYLIVRALLPLSRAFGRLPGAAGAGFASLLNSVHWPFHMINYVGACAGARIIPAARMPGMLDCVVTTLERHLQQETDGDLARGMRYPTTWDPFFTSCMTLAELYRYPTLHYRYHRQQLTMRVADPD